MSSLHDLITADANLQDYWPLDDGSGSTAADTTGTAATVHGSPTWSPSLPLVDGRNAILLNTESDGPGSGDYIQSATSYAPGATGSIELWFYPPDPATLTSPASYHMLAGFVGGDSTSGDSENAQVLTAYYESGHWKVALIMTVPSAGQLVEATKIATAFLTAGAWNYIVVTWNPSLATLYINGAAAGTLDPTAWFSDTGEFDVSEFSTANFNIGGGYLRPDSNSSLLYGLPGAYADVATYYGDELTGTEVTAHYLAGLTHTINVSATTGLYIGLDASPADLVAVTRMAIEVLVSDGGGTPRVTRMAVEVLRSSGISHAMSADTGLLVGDRGSESVLPIMRATTGLRVSDSGSEAVLPIMLATTDLWIADIGSEHLFPLVTATTDLRIGSSARDPFFCTASTNFFHGLIAFAPNQIGVSATTNVRLGQAASTSLASAYVFVSASTGLRIGHSSSRATVHEILAVAITGFRFGAVGLSSLARIFSARAVTSFWAGSLGAETRDIAASATTSIPIGNQVKAGREIFVSAVTGFMAADGDGERVVIASRGVTAIYVGVAASGVKGGHEAASGFQFGHLATASVALPWRRSELTRSPGGNLPHS